MPDLYSAGCLTSCHDASIQSPAPLGCVSLTVASSEIEPLYQIILSRNCMSFSQHIPYISFVLF